MNAPKVLLLVKCHLALLHILYKDKEKALEFKSFYIDVKIVKHRAGTVCGLLLLCWGREGRNNSSDTFTPHYFLLCEGRDAEAGDRSKQHYLVSQNLSINTCTAEMYLYRIKSNNAMQCRQVMINHYIFSFLCNMAYFK